MISFSIYFGIRYKSFLVYFCLRVCLGTCFSVWGPVCNLILIPLSLSRTVWPYLAFLNKSSPNTYEMMFGLFFKLYFVSQSCYSYILGNFWKHGATFYSNFWSHCGRNSFCIHAIQMKFFWKKIFKVCNFEVENLNQWFNGYGRSLISRGCEFKSRCHMQDKNKVVVKIVILL